MKIINDNEFYCVYCGKRGIPILRIKGAEREAGHLKKLFCLNCKKDTNHVECTLTGTYTPADFLTEYAYHNFDEEGNRIRPYGELKNLIHTGKIKLKEESEGEENE